MAFDRRVIVKALTIEGVGGEAFEDVDTRTRPRRRVDVAKVWKWRARGTGRKSSSVSAQER